MPSSGPPYGRVPSSGSPASSRDRQSCPPLSEDDALTVRLGELSASCPPHMLRANLLELLAQAAASGRELDCHLAGLTRLEPALLDGLLAFLQEARRSTGTVVVCVDTNISWQRLLLHSVDGFEGKLEGIRWSDRGSRKGASPPSSGADSEPLASQLPSSSF